jgi:hypothetical protein
MMQGTMLSSFKKIRHSGKIAFSRLQAGKCDFIRNPMWFSVGKRPNRIPHKFPFAQARRGNFAE